LVVRRLQLLGLMALAIAGGVLFFVKRNSSPVAKLLPPLRIAFPSSSSATSYDPTHIRWDWQYVFLENIYSSLVEIDPEGQLRSGAAQRFEWDGDVARFVMRPELKTADGDPITAKDAAASLKRLIILSQNSHGDLKQMLCPRAKLTSLSDPCPGIAVDGNTLILKPAGKSAANARSMLFPMLTTIDFAVIPTKAIDPKTLAIRDYRNTSGPYFVAQDSPDGHVVWHANPSHYHYRADMPQTIELVPADKDKKPDSIAKFLHGDVDFLLTVDRTPVDEVISFAQGRKDCNLHQTMDITVYFAQFTQKGRRLSPAKRLSLGQALRHVFAKEYFKRPGYKPAQQFFPSFSDGGLDSDQTKRLETLISSAKPIRDPGDITIRLTTGLPDKPAIEELIREELPSAKTEEGAASYFTPNIPVNKLPDLQIVATDSGFSEDIGLLSYSLTADRFGLGAAAGKRWLADYMATPAKPDRLRKLREIHFRALAEPFLIPLMTSPYAAVARKPWVIELPKLYANNPFWMVHWKE